MNITLYTTSKDKWYKDKANIVASSYTPLTEIKYNLVAISAPKKPVFRIDNNGDKCFDWDWFAKTFPSVDGSGVGFHFNKKYAKQWGIKLGGQRDSNRKDVPYFWLTADKEKAKGYDFSNFERILYHEKGHFWEDLDNDYGNKLVQDSVHNVDYNQKQIHKYHYLVDFSLLERKEIDKKQSIIDRLKALIASKQPTTLHKRLPDPFNNYISQAYAVPNKAYPATGHHIGIDYAVPLKTPILAPWEGEVSVVGTHGTLGNFCYFEYTWQGKKRVERFLHLNHVPERGKYKRGEVVAYSGNTGFSTGPHFHVDGWWNEVNTSIINAKNFKELTYNPHI